jgi:membrane associated rhomboid family serine protease
MEDVIFRMFSREMKCHALPVPANMGTIFENLKERLALPGLIRYVALLNALVFILHLLSPGYLSVLELDPRLILEGQVWRLVTWIFIPETLSPLWIFFSLLFLLYLGDGLEAGIGAARLTLFYISGVMLCTMVNFLFGLYGGGGAVGRANTFLNLSLLLAFATLYPGFKVLVFFILPVRIAWLAGFSVLLMLIAVLGQPPVVAATLATALLNYLLFFRNELTDKLGRADGNSRRSNGPFTKKPVTIEPLHLCATCKRNEATNPDLEFRVSSDGSEYCLEHLPGK